MLVITGGCGFIGSAMIRFLNQTNRNDLIIVDNHNVYPRNLKNLNLILIIFSIFKLLLL